MSNPSSGPGSGPSSGAETGAAPGRESPPPMPRWVKWPAIVIGILVVALAVVRLAGLGGEHGPGRHPPPGGAGAPPAGVVAAGPDGHAPLAGGRE